MPLVVRTTGVEEYLDAAGQAHIKALILGEPSAGKTRSASFWPDPIFFDCEKGRMSLADRNVAYVEITSSSDMDAALRMLEIECATTAPTDRKYKTLVIDTFDAYQRIVMQEILRQLKKESFTDYREWGQLDSKMQNLVSRLHKLSMNIVVNVHTKSTKDGEDGPIVKEPKLKGDLREQISAEFDLVGYMATYWEAVQGERVLSRAVKWYPEPNMPILKDRSGQLPRYTPVTFTDDDYLGLFNAIYGGDHFDSLGAGQQVGEIATGEDTAPAPVAPHAGGPVAQKASARVAPVPAQAVAARTEPAARAAKKAPAVPPARKATVPPAKKTAPPTQAPAPAQEARQEPQEPQEPQGEVEEPPTARPTAQPVFQAPEEPVAAALEDPDQTMEGAVAVVEETLGGEVVSTERDVEPDEVPPAETAPPAAPAAPAAQTGGIPCGTPVNDKVTTSVPGCGKDTSTLSGPEQDLVNIALIKTRHHLCPQCLTAWKNAKAS